MTEAHKFGGNWTKEKLKRVEKYLKAYATIMNKQNFRFAYIDAFAGVAENPLLLRNSKNNPLYLLCFASGNPRGAKTAIKIAQDILKR